MRIKYVFFALLILGATHPSIASNCLAPSLVAVSGLVPGMDGNTVQQLGNLLSVETSDGEDDGGPYTAYTYQFADYDIDVVHNSIDLIRITNPDYLWAGKIRFGSDRRLVMDQLSLNPVVDEEDSSQHVICSDAGDVYVILRYQDNKLTDIRLVLDRP